MLEGIPLTLVIYTPPCFSSKELKTLGGLKDYASICLGYTPIVIKNRPRLVRR